MTNNLRSRTDRLASVAYEAWRAHCELNRAMGRYDTLTARAQDGWRAIAQAVDREIAVEIAGAETPNVADD